MTRHAPSNGPSADRSLSGKPERSAPTFAVARATRVWSAESSSGCAASARGVANNSIANVRIGTLARGGPPGQDTVGTGTPAQAQAGCDQSTSSTRLLDI